MNKLTKQLVAALFLSTAFYASSGEFGVQTARASEVLSTSSAQTAVIQSTVRLRTAPSVSSGVLSYLKEGETVTVLEKTNAYFYKVRTADGEIGYCSSQGRYISLTGAGAAPQPSPVAPAPVPAASGAIEAVIAKGMAYLGTPYEFGSSRSDTSTFDCSDFIRQIYLEGMNIKLPADSRQQGDWVKQNSSAVTDISDLKRGDLMFFMSYRGSSPAAYAGIDKSAQRITHVALYLGDGQILHTYSVSSGGVRVDKLSASWTSRFLFGGSVVH
ncbi:C40 family peptidase [Paenibacillus sabinae]|uniref:Cell wall-associated hydrolase (Invasion-associated protein) n=1 Tax=Paenibacillus sabinae T27 TaxID=1268072 RepID=X4ZHS6_9BACL|nr:C40 family peptidase [Paenibacillus sabinae]AHV99066.1 cell wall-associated hydrolase (invasion-associated protein) [Paenibacillus sabinae T27]